MINPSDILQLCRLCLVEDGVNNSIFQESSELRSIFLKISSCLPVSIHKDDGLPDKICDTCSTKLDSFYQFWNETATAEKQLLQWLNQTTQTNLDQADTSKKMESPEVKQEEIDESNMDPIDMSSDAQTYILQQQQLPYTSVPTDSHNTSESDEPKTKRPRRASAVKALEQMESEDEDDPDMAPDTYAKTESEDSDKEEEEEANHQENPSTTSMEEQPGPSGIAKKRVVLDDTPVYSGQKIKPCHVVLNDIKGLLDSDGYYVVPGRSRRALTCYRCFKKFYSAEALEVHKAEHEPESGEEDVYAISDSEIEIEIESESDEEEKEQVVEPPMKRNSKSPNQKRIDPLMVTPKPKMNTTEQVSKISELSQPKQVQVVEPIMGKPKINVASASPPVQSSNSAQQSADDKKLPVLCNIQIRCLSCDVLFTNSELLMHHKSVDVNKPCCFTCKVCTASYSQPADYLTHIMQHNTFSSSRYGYRGGHRRRPEFRCTYCQKEFEHRFLLKQHEDTEHKKEIQPQVTPEVVVVEETIAEIHPPPKPIEIAPKQRLILPKQENIEVTNSAGATSGGVKPKIWVIKEAMMKSPEPSKPYEQNAVTVASVGSAKRKLDDIETLRELVKPGKRGRPSKAASSYVIMPDERLSTPAVKAFEQSSSLTCDECYDVFETKAAFDEHMVFHGENKDESDNDHDYPCNLCNVRFKSVAGLRRHQTCIHEKMTSFVCVKCSKIFSSRKGLNIHRGSCTGNSS